MRLAKRRFVALLLAIVFCAGAFNTTLATNKVSADGAYKDRIVRVGMYVSTSLIDTRRFATKNTSSTGFDIGFASGNNFNTAFSITTKSIVILPHVNASVNASTGTGSPSGNGNVGAYSAVVGAFSDWNSAKSAANAFSDGFVAVVKGGYEVRRFASTNAKTVIEKSNNGIVTAPVSGGLTILDSNTGKILFTVEDTSKRFAIRARNGGTVAVPTGESTLRNYYGFFEYSVSDGKLKMINCLPLETYTKCVMSVEIGTTFSAENRKAFSLLVRTYALACKHGSDFNVCPTTCCQVYPGTFRMSESNNAIVDSTRGMYLTYEGSPISAQYHVSNGGATCSALAAWGSRSVPYLTTVFQEEDNDGIKWEHTYTKDEFYEYIKSRKTFSSLSGKELSMKILSTDPYGSDYITHLSVSDGKGNTVDVKSAEDVRVAIGYKSANFDIEYSTEIEVLGADGKVTKRKVTGVMTEEGYKPFESFGDEYKTVMGETIEPEIVKINGSGAGHGVGYSVWGAEQLAKDGYNFKYILNVYYQGTTISKVS